MDFKIVVEDPDCIPMEKRLNVLKILIARGGIINDTKRPPLVVAIEREEVPIVQLLLDNGADSIINDNAPMKKACEKGNLEIIKLLLDKEAKITETEISLIPQSSNNYQDIIKLLEK